jgi:asparagine synthase (glutamine-hydrolysing)
VDQLLTGGADGRGLVALFDPEGPDARRFRRISLAPDPRLPSANPFRVLIDGEIFNLAGLARELSLGQASPEDVVAAGYARWSRDVLRRLRGSFALAVVDERAGRALIAADQAGGHSIYYRAEGNRLVVASEIRPLLGLLPSRPAPDPVSVVHWFSDNAAPTGQTLYEGIEELPGGECFELSNLGWRRTTYWRPRYEPDAGLSTEGAAELLWDALLEAVRVRLQGSGLVGLVMSGGIDSAAVAAAAVEAAGEQGSAPRGYSAVFPGYPDQRVDESERIDALVKSLDLESTQVRIDPGGAFALSVDWLEAWELPLGGPGYLLERPLLELAAAAGVEAVLDGQAGDEGFAVSPFWLADLVRRGRIASSVRMARRLPDGSGSLRDLVDTWLLYALRGAMPLGPHAAYRRRRNPYRHAPGFLTRESARLHVETDQV